MMQIRKKRLLTAIFIVLAFFFNSVRGFTQQSDLRELSNDLSDIADDVAGALPFMATIGLNWADNYIGQLVDIPPHWGIGLTVGATTLKIDRLNALLSKFGYESDDSFSSKQLLPAYVLETRIGGFKGYPFDIGVKWGWLPYMPLFNNSINYESVIYGVDFRWELMTDRPMFPGLSVGLEIDRATGGLRRDASLTIPTSALSSINIQGGTAGVVWEAWVFDLKLLVSKKFWVPRLNVFGGLRLGVAITKTGYIFADGNSIFIQGSFLSDKSDGDRETIQSALQAESGNTTTFEVTEDHIIGWIDAVGIDFNVYQGVSIRFTNMTNLTASLMFDIVHFEMGANISFKYQQQ
jgi:hypothetical protein